MDIDGMLLELEYVGLSYREAQSIIVLLQFINKGDYVEDRQAEEFTSCEMNRLYFVRYLISQGKISEN